MSSVPTRFDPRPQVEVDIDEPCAACGIPLSQHGVNVGYNRAEAKLTRDGYVHKLCAIEEAEVVEIKSLPPGEDHGEE